MVGLEKSRHLLNSCDIDGLLLLEQRQQLPCGTLRIEAGIEDFKYFHCGLYRPEFNCMMRDLSPFCVVCKERIRETLAPYLACYLDVSYYMQRNDESLESEAQLEPSDDAVYKIIVTNTLQETFGPMKNFPSISILNVST